MWTCPTCGIEGNADDLSACPGCGFSRRQKLSLSGVNGTLVLRTGCVFGYKNLGELVGEDSRFAERRQFEIARSTDGWSVHAFPGTKNGTRLNGGDLTSDAVSLSDGDIITISSRRDGSRTVAEIHITIN